MHRGSRQAGLTRPAIIRQHVRWRADPDPDRAVRADPGLSAGPGFGLRLARPVSAGLRLVDLSHPDHHAASVHLHDADHSLSVAGARNRRRSLERSFSFKELTWVT